MILLCFIPFSFFLFFFYKSIKEKKTIASCIVGLYLLSAFSSFFLRDTIQTHDFETDTIEVFLLYTFLLLPFILLSFHIKPFTNINDLPKGTFVNILMFIMFFGAIYSIVYLTPYAIESLLDSAVEVKGGKEVLPPNFFTTIAVGFPTFYYIYIFLFFTSLVQKRPLIVTLGMLVGVLSFIINTYTRANRDGVFLTITGLLIGFFMFKSLLSKKQLSILKRFFIIMVLVNLYFIYQITNQRFGSGWEDFKTGILSYLGMQPFIFSDWLKYNETFNYGTQHFALFRRIIGLSVDKINYFNAPYTWKFGTFLTAFYSVSGISSMIILCIIFWGYFKRQFNKLSKRNTIAAFFILGFYFQFTTSGLFYFRLGTEGGNLFIILSLIIIFILNRRKITVN